QIAADVGAVGDADAVFFRRTRSGAVDLDPQDHARRLAPELDVEHLEPVAGGHALGDRPHLLDDGFRAHKLKKWAPAHWSLPKAFESKIIARPRPGSGHGAGDQVVVAGLDDFDLSKIPGPER